MITNYPNQVPRIEVLPGISDHDIVFFEFNITPAKIKQIPRNIPLYNKANWDNIKIEINSLKNKLQEKANILSMNDLWNEFKSSLNKLVSQHISHKKILSKPKTPWVTPKTKTLMKRRDRLYRKMKKVETKILKTNTNISNIMYKKNSDTLTGLT